MAIARWHPWMGRARDASGPGRGYHPSLMTITLLLLLVGLLAFANGSNENGKGVATLVGYGTAGPKTALAFATVSTAAGGVIAFWFAGGLLASFSTALFSKGT